MALQGYHIAENPLVSTPVMVNLDGFVLTHTYENRRNSVRRMLTAFCRRFKPKIKMSLDNPKNLAFSVGPDNNMEFKIYPTQMLDSKRVIEETVGCKICRNFWP